MESMGEEAPAPPFVHCGVQGRDPTTVRRVQSGPKVALPLTGWETPDRLPELELGSPASNHWFLASRTTRVHERDLEFSQHARLSQLR
jgi:hypothetical protein